MRARRVRPVLGLLALLFEAVPARPQGIITDVTPSPAPGVACSLNSITVNGTAACSGFVFDLADGTKPAHLPGQFPVVVYHTYTRAGLYKPTATGQGDCGGMVSASLQVVGPTISSMFPFSVVKPGGSVILQGEHFGDLPGQLVIHLNLYQGPGNPGGPGYFGGPLDVPLQNVQWGDTFAAGTIPSTITGVLDQEATFTVAAGCGAISSPWSAFFTAGRDFVSLELDRISCSTFTSASNECQRSGGQNWPLECGFPPPAGLDPGDYGIYGYHASGWGPGDAGSDDFWATLNNQWTFDSLGASEPTGWKVGNGSMATFTFVSSSGGNPQMAVQWHADACGAISYGDGVNITGPVGVPH